MKTGLITENECPFGISARSCEYQKTRAKSWDKAIRGELIFLCKLDDEKVCPFSRDSAITSW